MLGNDLVGTFTIFAAANVLDKPNGDDEDKRTSAVGKESLVKVDTVVKTYIQQR